MKKIFVIVITFFAIILNAQSPCWAAELFKDIANSKDNAFKTFFKNAPKENYEAYKYLHNGGGVKNNTDVLASLADDLAKPKYKLAEQFTAFPEDVKIWEVIKENPFLAYELMKETDNAGWMRFKKSEFFNAATKKGNEFEQSMLNKVKTRTGIEYDKLRKLVPDIDDRKLISQMQFCVPGLVPPCSAQGEYFVADQVWVKYDAKGNIQDMIIVDTKLSEKTTLSAGQAMAKQQAGKGSLAYKPDKVRKIDESSMDLPKEIKQGQEIEVKSFYKMYGDGNNQFLGIK